MWVLNKKYVLLGYVLSKISTPAATPWSTSSAYLQEQLDQKCHFQHKDLIDESILHQNFVLISSKQ